MKLAECKMGVLVCVKAEALETTELRIGHVVGLADPDNLNPNSILAQLRNKAGQVPVTAHKVWPVVLFAGNERGVVINYEDLEPFTAF